MMTRQQRIEYEILDCTLNRARSGDGYPTTVSEFTKQLRGLFPDIEGGEFMQTCKRLHADHRLDLCQRHGSISRPYQGVADDVWFFAGGIYLARAALSWEYFDELVRLIDLPHGFHGRIPSRK